MAALLLIVAAGSGSRLGRDEPKALVPLAGRPILAWALEALLPLDFARSRRGRSSGPHGGVLPDRRRQGADRGRRATRDRSPSGAASKRSRPADGDIVAIHDAARPFVTAAETESVLRAAQETGAAIAATRVVDTVKRAASGRVVETVDRDGLFGAATPQAFRAETLRRAIGAGGDATDEAALCERLGIPVAVVPVSRLSFKITTPEDLELAEAILARRGR